MSDKPPIEVVAVNLKAAMKLPPEQKLEVIAGLLLAAFWAGDKLTQRLNELLPNTPADEKATEYIHTMGVSIKVACKLAGKDPDYYESCGIKFLNHDISPIDLKDLS